MIFCLFLGLDFKSCMIIILIASISLFLFNYINETNKYYINRLNNISQSEIDNYLKNNVKPLKVITNNNFKKLYNNEIKNEINKINNKLVKLKNTNNNLNSKNNTNNINNINNNINNEIIPSKYYNQEDCTTDMSCIIKPDNINLGINNEQNNKANNKANNIENNER